MPDDWHGKPDEVNTAVSYFEGNLGSDYRPDIIAINA